jgi:hypothetical protein
MSTDPIKTAMTAIIPTVITATVEADERTGVAAINTEVVSADIHLGITHSTITGGFQGLGRRILDQDSDMSTPLNV